MPLEDDFSDILKKARMGQGLSVAEVAQASGLTVEQMTALERGRTPSAAEIDATASVLHLSASALKANTLERWLPAPAPAWVTNGVTGVHTVHGDIGGYAVKGYVLYDTEAREALLIDTGYNPSAMIGMLEERKLRLTAVALTHGHTDHAGGLDRIMSRSWVPVYLGEGDASLLGWQPMGEALRAPADGEVLSVGRLRVRCLRTPGHTPGGVCYATELAGGRLCFVGDTLFAGSIGRANPFSLYPHHLDSVRTRVLTLPEETVLLPGHGPATTVREERTHNPFGAATAERRS